MCLRRQSFSHYYQFFLQQKLVFAAIACLLAAGCLKQKEPPSIVAQVENSVLTLQDLESRFPSEYSGIITREQYLDYVKRWVDEEIFLHEALRKKFHRQPDIEKKIEEQRKHIIVEEYLSKENSTFSFTPDEAVVRQYYETHPDAFSRTDPETRFSEIVLPSQKEAWEVRSQIQNENFLEIQHKFSRGVKVESFESLAYRQFEKIESCIAETVFSLRIGGTSLPIDCGEDFRIVRVVDRKEPGTIRPFEEVKDEIASLMINNRKKQYLEKRLEDLKSEFFFTFNPELIPGHSVNDTLSVDSDSIP